MYGKGIFFMPLIIKNVGVSVYGGFVLLSSLLAIVCGISSFGVGFRAKRFLPAAETPARAGLFYPQLSFQLLSIGALSIVLVVLDPLVRARFYKGQTDYSAAVIPLYLAGWALYSQGTEYFRYTSRLKLMTAAAIPFSYLDVFFVWILLRFRGSVTVGDLIASQACAALVIALPCFWIIFREIGMRISLYDWRALSADVKVGFPMVLNLIVDFILAVSDRYLIAFFLGVTAVGFYNPGYVLGSAVIFVPKAIGTALPQLLAKAIDEGGEHEAMRMLNYAIRIFLLIAIPFVFACCVLGKPILVILANESVARQAQWVAPIVAAGTLFCGLNMILSNALFVSLKTKAIFQMNVFASLFNLAANAVFLLLIPSILVAAVTTLLSYLIAFVVAYRIVREDWEIDFQAKVLFKSIAASLGMSLSMLWAARFFLPDAGGLTQILVLSGGGLGVYLGGLILLEAFTDQELRFARSYLARA